jgi:hypothetical protein
MGDEVIIAHQVVLSIEAFRPLSLSLSLSSWRVAIIIDDPPLIPSMTEPNLYTAALFDVLPPPLAEKQLCFLRPNTLRAPPNSACVHGGRVPRGGEGRGEAASPSTIVLVSRFDVERGGENEHTRRKADIVDPQQ